MPSSYAVWRLVDVDHNLWQPTDCDTFDQAADAWLTGAQVGERMEITERVPVRVADGRLAAGLPAPRAPRLPRKPRTTSMSARVVDALRNAPNGLSRAQLAARTGLTKTDAGTAVAGLMKRGMARSEQHSPDEERGRPAPGHETIAVYFLVEANE